MYRVYELRSRRLMRFSDFQVGIGASLKMQLRGALELFFLFLGCGVFRNLSDAIRTSLSLLSKHLIYPWIWCLSQEQRSFQKLVFSSLYIITGLSFVLRPAFQPVLLKISQLMDYILCIEDQCGELSSYLLFELYLYLFQILYSYATGF